MKSMSCKQLGGACDTVFQARTFDEMVELSKQHGKAMFEQQDPAHLKAMSEMRTRMQDPDAMTRWFEARRQEFDALPQE